MKQGATNHSWHGHAGGIAIVIALDTSSAVSEEEFLTARAQVRCRIAWHDNTCTCARAADVVDELHWHVYRAVWCVRVVRYTDTSMWTPLHACVRFTAVLAVLVSSTFNDIYTHVYDVSTKRAGLVAPRATSTGTANQRNQQHAAPCMCTLHLCRASLVSVHAVLHSGRPCTHSLTTTNRTRQLPRLTYALCMLQRALTLKL